MPIILIPVSLVILGILGFAHAVVYEALITIVSLVFPGFLTWRMIVGLRIVFVLLTLSFIGMTILSFSFRDIFTRVAYKISSVWTGFLMYLFFAAFGYGALVFLNNISVDHFHGANHNLLYSEIGFVFFVSALLIGVYGVIHAGKTVVTRVPVRLPNLPQSWKGKKAVWISDIHLGHNRGVVFLEKIVKKIQALQPDMVFIGGDLFDGVSIDAHAAIAPLRDLCAGVISAQTPHVIPNGVYFIMGNHEEFSEKSRGRFLEAVRSIPGLRVLEDELVTIDGVDIVGVDYEHAGNAAKLSVILSRLPLQSAAEKPGRPSILLKHEPRDLDVAAMAGISFQISGHTHKGQVFPATLLSSLVYPGFNYGLHERTARSGQKMLVYTSSGVGTWGPPLRVGTRSEIVLFEFE